MEEKMTAFEMATHYYPRLWNKERIKTLYEEGKLTKEEYDFIVNKATNQ